jgi:hypothetical protein
MTLHLEALTGALLLLLDFHPLCTTPHGQSMGALALSLKFPSQVAVARLLSTLFLRGVDQLIVAGHLSTGLASRMRRLTKMLPTLRLQRHFSCA